MVARKQNLQKLSNREAGIVDYMCVKIWDRWESVPLALKKSTFMVLIFILSHEASPRVSRQSSGAIEDKA